MKREEQIERSRQKILDAALEEYGTKSYSETSINTICDKNGISKGLIYHYFGNVDNLFLACLEQSYTTLFKYMKKNLEFEKSNSNDLFESFFTTRMSFSRENPQMQNIMTSAHYQAPAHLQDKIKELRKKLVEYNTEIASRFFNQLDVPSSLSVDETLPFFMAYIDFVMNYIRSRQAPDTPKKKVGEDNLPFFKKSVEWLLHGILKN